jgi:ABC-type phosphate transport system ATPase subunit
MIKDTDVTTIMATHDIMQAKRVAEYIIFINQGKVKECAGAATFFNRPATEEARKFIEGKL